MSKEHSWCLAVICAIILLIALAPVYFMTKRQNKEDAACAAKGGEMIRSRAKDFCVKKESLL